MKRIINTSNAPAPIGPYSQAIEAGDMLYVSGQVAINPLDNQVFKGSIEEETHLVLQNVGAILQAAGYTFSQIIKTSIFLSNMSLFSKVNEAYATYFDSDFPARETVAVLGLPKGVNVEITVIAYKG